MSVNIKIPKLNSVKFLLLFSIFVSFTFEIIVGQSSLNIILKGIKYIFMLIPILLSLLEILLNRKRKYMFKSELNIGLVMVIVLLILSLYYSVKEAMFSLESIIELVQMFFPFIISFLLINFISEDDIILFMKYALVITIIGYIIYEFKSGVNLFSIKNYLKISLINSYSPFENDSFAEIASALSAFFIYYRKKLPGFCFFSIILNFLIFKRVLLLMTILLFIITLFDQENKSVPTYALIIDNIIWIGIIFITFKIYKDYTYRYDHFRDVLANFTVTRIYRFWYVIERHFKSYGLGSTSVYLIKQNISYVGVNFEMDFIRIMFELGPIAIITMVYSYLKIAKSNLYSIILINFCFLNLLMANGILNYWGYSIRFIVILLILKKNKLIENNRKVKFVLKENF